MISSISVAPTRSGMGLQAATAIAEELRSILAHQSGARIIFAAGPSQTEVLASLRTQPEIDWPRVTAFHMDEYIDLAPDHPQRFGNWLGRAIFDHLPFGAVHLIEPGSYPASAAREYAALLAEAPIDIVCLGIGINGHLAFNDPPADLNDPIPVKIVRLDAACRSQQVQDRCFSSIEDVPEQAITLTIPRLLAARRLFCSVPGAFKRQAVHRALYDPIGSDWPATALRTHAACSLYLDRDSAPENLPA
jgi:glucosamine-6-phosphate deaminase